MIILTKLGREKKKIVINSDLIETVEEIPDTVITLNTGKKYIVSEKKEEIIKKVVEFRRQISSFRLN